MRTHTSPPQPPPPSPPWSKHVLVHRSGVSEGYYTTRSNSWIAFCFFFQFDFLWKRSSELSFTCQKRGSKALFYHSLYTFKRMFLFFKSRTKTKSRSRLFFIINPALSQPRENKSERIRDSTTGSPHRHLKALLYIKSHLTLIVSLFLFLQCSPQIFVCTKIKTLHI